MILQYAMVFCAALGALYFLLRKAYQKFSAKTNCESDCGCEVSELKKQGHF